MLIGIRDNLLRQKKSDSENIRVADLLKHVNLKLKTAKRKAKKEYYEKLLKTSNARLLWQRINGMLGKDTKKNTIELDVNGSIVAENGDVANAIGNWSKSGGPVAELG